MKTCNRDLLLEELNDDPRLRDFLSNSNLGESSVLSLRLLLLSEEDFSFSSALISSNFCFITFRSVARMDLPE